MERGSLSRPFYVHGYLCASHPVEVLLLCITGTVCLLTLNIYDATHASEGSVVSSPADKIALPTNIHVHISATSYFLALLCLYLQCKKLIHGGISVLLGVVGIFLVFSFTVYTSVVGNIFGGEFAVLREALPFFCLLSDFVTVGDLAKFALSASSYEEAYSKIAQGVATLGPSVTLNTLVGALVIGVGSLSGVGGLETASYFGCLALLSHYIMFMTFLPACLSLFLEMCFRGQSQPSWLIEPSSNLMVVEQEHISNPLLQHVKVIMSAGLMFVHAHSWLMVRPTATLEAQNHTQANDKLSRFLAVNAEEVLAFVLAVLVAARYMYLEKDKADNLLEVKECKEKTAATQIETTTSNGKDSITITDNAESRGSSVASISTSEKSFKVKDQKEKTATRQMYTTTKCKGKDLINASTDSAENRKGVISSTGTSKITKDFYTNAQVLLRKSQTPRKRSATFCLGDSSSLDEDLSDQSRERSDIDIESIVEKKRSFSLLFNKAPKKSHSSHDIFKNPAKESESTTLHSGKELKVPKVKVTRHESLKDQQGQHSPPLKSLIEGKTSYESCTRSIHECKQIMKEPDGIFKLNDNEICCLVEEKVIPFYQLETALNDYTRAVSIRRKVTARKMNKSQECLKDLPHKHYDYTLVSGACCENVIGYMPIPVGVAGPLLLDGRLFYIPMATTEGCLVASTNRGCRALSVSGGVRSSILGDGMTRGPVVRFPSAMQASEAKLWLEDEYNFDVIKQAFDGTSRFARLKSIKCAVAGRLLFARFAATTGDAMGMNMLSKGTENALKELQLQFPCMEIISLSGNYCTDKKATAMNWIEGRGKSVVCEAIIPGHVVMKVLKTSITALTELNTSKNLVGSAMAGAIGGFNAHAANIVTALFIATGQDPAQNMESSNCITLLEPCGPNHEDLYISCTMPSLEVGTVGGGTILPAQASCLEMLGVKGASSKEPGQNASQLARIICGTVLAGELSLLSALAAGQLVQSHLKHNRSTINLISNDEAAKNCAVL